MVLADGDSGEPVFRGPGRIEIISDAEIKFFMHATPAIDIRHAMHALKRESALTYDQRDLLHLHAIDYQSTEWACGPTRIAFSTDYNRGWPLRGEVGSMVTQASGAWISKRSSVELLLIPPIDVPMSTHLVKSAHLGDKKIFQSWGPGQHTVDVLGTKIAFSYEPSGEALWITADTSIALNHPCLENWLTEPLRILLGTPIYPRMVARNLGDGSAQVWLRPSPRHKSRSAIGLMQTTARNYSYRNRFWELYTQLLTLIARAQGFEPHVLTRYYNELADAQLASPWMLTLVMAGTVEALASGLMTDSDTASEFSDAHLASMKNHIKSWGEDIKLRDRMLSSLSMVRRRSVLSFMRGLADKGVIQSMHVQTWQDIRNRVMHGNLVEPWSTEESDQRLRQIRDLVHDLTRARIKTGY